MKKKRNIKMFFCYALILSLAVVLTKVPVSASQKVPLSGHASWTNQYESAEEMVDNADIVVYGTVVDQSCEQRYDLVFTRSFIDVHEVFKGSSDLLENNIEVLQTGGTLNETITPAILEMPLFEIGQEGIFVLEKTEYDPTYGQYYLVSGGYQGVLSGESDIDSLSEIKNELSDMSSPITVSPRMVDRGWNQSSIDFNYSSNVTRPALVSSGLTAWNNIASVTLYYSGSSYAGIQVAENYYGSTGWDAYTYYYSSTSNGPLTGADIRLNRSSMGGFTDFQYKAVVCHEGGHALGMDGHQYSGSASIMQPYTSDYYNKYNTPQSLDISTLRGMYP